MHIVFGSTTEILITYFGKQFPQFIINFSLRLLKPTGN